MRTLARPKLIAAVIGVAVLVIASVVILVVTSTQGEPTGPATPTPARGATPVVTPRTSSAPTLPAEHEENIPANETQSTQIRLANDYIDAFLAAESAEARIAALQELGTPQNLADIREIDQSRVPAATRVPGQDAALDPSSSTDSRAYAHVRLTDDSWWGMWLVRDANAPRGWAVASLEKFGH